MMPKIIAHRGASAHAPENTMAAFQLALEKKADGFELDVMLTMDNQIVVIHDDTVDRTTNGSGRVRDMTLEEIQSLEAGDGEKVPSLKEVFERFGGHCLINIELKNYSSPFDSLPIDVARLVKAYDLEKSVLISSFNPFNLRRFRRQTPEADLGLITLTNTAKNWIWRLFQYEALHPQFNDVDETLVHGLHARSLQVNVWTADEPAEIRRLAALNVDVIITNTPQRAREVLESYL